jgi:hypothetical protein
LPVKFHSAYNEKIDIVLLLKVSKLDLIEQVARAMNLTSNKEMKSLKEVLFPSLLCSGGYRHSSYILLSFLWLPKMGKGQRN